MHEAVIIFIRNNCSAVLKIFFTINESRTVANHKIHCSVVQSFAERVNFSFICKMKILKRQLKFCALTCMFLPFNSSQFFKKVYFSFILMFTSIHLSSILFQSLMIFFTENSNELIDVIFFLSFTMLIAVRFCVLQLRRQKIIECWDILRSKEFMPQNQQEQRIEDFNEFMHKYENIS